MTLGSKEKTLAQDRPSPKSQAGIGSAPLISTHFAPVVKIPTQRPAARLVRIRSEPNRQPTPERERVAWLQDLLGSQVHTQQRQQHQILTKTYYTNYGIL